MPTLDQIRQAAARRTDDDGRVRDAELVDRFTTYSTVAEVVSLNPARVEILSGRTVTVDAYVGPVPAVGDIVLVFEIARFRVVVSGVEIV